MSERDYPARPKQKSGKHLDMVLLSHGGNEHANLRPWEDALRKKLESTPPHMRVVAFTESANIPQSTAHRLTTLYSMGIDPEAAEIEVDIENLKSQVVLQPGQRLVDDSVLREKLQKLYDKDKNFEKEKRAILTRLQKDFGERIVWVTEWQSEETIAYGAARDEESAKALAEGRLSEHVKSPKTLLSDVTYMEDREGNLTRTIDEIFSDPTVAGGVLEIGTNHSQMARDVQASGHSVTRHFVGKEPGKPYYFTPAARIRRKLRANPEKQIGEKEIAEHGHSFNEAVAMTREIEMRERLGFVVDKQELYKAAHEKIKLKVEEDFPVRSFTVDSQGVAVENSQAPYDVRDEIPQPTTGEPETDIDAKYLDGCDYDYPTAAQNTLFTRYGLDESAPQQPTQRYATHEVDE